MKTHSFVLCVAALSSLSLAAYAEDTKTEAQAPNDAQIAAIVVAANTVDVKAGKQAMKKTKNPEIKKFAQQMVTDHTAVNKQASDLVKKLGVKPEPSDTSKDLVANGEKKSEELAKKKGKDFDKAYVDNEVAYHEAVLGVIDNTLIPSAKNQELKDLITKVRPAIEAHLDHAKHLQMAMNK